MACSPCSRTVIRTDNVRPIELEQLQRACAHVHGQFFVLTTCDRYVDGQIFNGNLDRPKHKTTKPRKCAK